MTGEHDGPDLRVRPERPEDVPAIRLLNERAFGGAEEADLVDALRAAGKATCSLVAEGERRIVGHILFSPVTLETGPGAVVEGIGLAPMAVLPENQRSGIGSRLVREGLERCRRDGHEWCVVLGHPGYYPRFGFAPASRFGMRSEYDAPDEAFLALELRPGSLRGRRGLVRYAPEFRGVA